MRFEDFLHIFSTLSKKKALLKFFYQNNFVILYIHYITCQALISDTGYPFSANSIAGFKISPRDNLPLPNHSIQSTHPAAAPGIVEEFIFVYGIEFLVIPNLSRTYSSV